MEKERQIVPFLIVFPFMSSVNLIAVPKKIKCTSKKEQNNEDQQPTPQSSDIEINRRCPCCFISPCIAYSNRAARWIGLGRPANMENPSIRKQIYRRFWKIMANNGGWHIPEYMEKKIRIGGGDWVLTHRRELMPECVTSLARQLYPNPKTFHIWIICGNK